MSEYNPDGILLTHEQWNRITALLTPMQKNKIFKQGIIGDFIPTLDQSDDLQLKLKYWEYFKPWEPKVWTANENCQYNDYPYQCISGHDSTENPDWNPKDTPALFRPYHATVAEFALPWRAPAGAHDMYKKGEYMVYEDELTYKALMDTTYTPIEYPQAWRKQ